MLKTCKNCKHSACFAVGVRNSVSGSYTCQKYPNRANVDAAHRCFWFVGHNSFSDKIERHFQQNWKYWLGLLLPVFIAVAGFVLKGLLAGYGGVYK